MTASHHRSLGRRLLKLKQKRRIFDFHDCINVLESCLHDSELRLNSIVSVGDLLSDSLFSGCLKITREQFHEFILHILNEIQSR